MHNLEGEKSRTRRDRDLLLFRVLLSAVSLTLVGLGILAMATQHYYGRSNKYGVHELALDGQAATAMGVAMLLFGLTPLAVWLRSKWQAILWSMACLVGAALAVAVSIHLRAV